MAFDVITPTFFGSGSVAVDPSTTTFRTTPTDSVDYLKDIEIANNGAADAVVTVWLVPQGGSIVDAYLLFPGVTVAANSLVQWTGIQIMEENARLVAMSSAAGVSLHASGGNGVTDAD